MKKSSKIFVSGHKGMVGSAVLRKLRKHGYDSIIVRDRSDLDLRNQEDVATFFSKERPDIVINAAAKVGGIMANKNFPYQFLSENLLIQNNMIQAAHKYEVKTFIFLGSSCIYPKFSKQPIKEEYLLTGALEPTNEAYAIAKIAGVKLMESIRTQFGKNFISLMPTNLYGPNDNFDLKSSHVLPALMRKFHEAKLNNNAPVELWGTGSPRREFLHVDDLATAILFCMESKLPETIYNVGSGIDLSIQELALMIQMTTGHTGDITWNHSYPDGTPRKLLDVTRLKKLGWTASINLLEGVKETYHWFKDDQQMYRNVEI